MISFNDIYDAYEQADFGHEYGVTAHLNVAKGKIVVVPSNMTAGDEEIEAAEKELETGEWIPLPDKHDLHLGRQLVFRFAQEHLSTIDCERVERIFSHRGAYGNWKDSLAERDLLNRWHEFSDAAEIKALKDWLVGMDIEFEDKEQAKTRKKPNENSKEKSSP